MQPNENDPATSGLQPTTACNCRAVVPSLVIYIALWKATKKTSAVRNVSPHKGGVKKGNKDGKQNSATSDRAKAVSSQHTVNRSRVRVGASRKSGEAFGLLEHPHPQGVRRSRLPRVAAMAAFNMLMAAVLEMWKRKFRKKVRSPVVGLGAVVFSF